MSSKNTTNVTYTSQQYNKRALIIVGSIIGVIILAALFYQAGYSAGVGSMPTNTQQTTVSDVKETVLEEEVKPREPISLSGTGQQATEPIDLVAGLATVKIKHSGERHFSIWVLDKNADRVELLVNETGAFDGSKAFQVPASDKYILDVSADGPWEVAISQY